MTIIPMRDLKDTVNIEKLCKEENGPIFVTKNGYGRLVVMDMNYYEKALKDFIEAKLVEEGLTDVKEGKITDGKTAIKEVAEKYGLSL